MKAVQGLSRHVPAIAIAVSLALVLTIGLQPAAGGTPVTLPASANGTNGNPGLLVYACPSTDPGADGFVQVLAPMPVREDGLSPFELVQDGNFGWYLGVTGDSDETDPSLLAERNRTMEVQGNWAAGDTVTLTVSGRISEAGFDASTFVVSRQVVDPSFANGSGTISDPYLISSQSDLNKVRCYMNKHFALAGNISLTGKWLPIGTSTRVFEGSLDGRGYSISGLDVGNMGDQHVGLFGVANDAYIRNLSIESPKANGNFRVGIVAGTGQSTAIENVTVNNADVRGHREVGILVGRLEGGGQIIDTRVSGIISGLPVAYRSDLHWDGPNLILFQEPSTIGGMLGSDTGGHTHLKNTVDVKILITPEKNLYQEALAVSRTLQRRQDLSSIGGYAGDADGDPASTFRFLNIKSQIEIESIFDVRRIGGVAGRNESVWSELQVDSDIHVVTTGDDVLMVDSDGDQNIFEIGGVFGYVNELTVQLSSINSKLLIERANPGNNRHAISNTGSRVFVEKVGGVAGEYDDITSDAFNRAKVDIEITDVAEIERVGGYFGRYADDDEGVGYTDNFVSGSIRLRAQDLIQSISGYGNLEGSQALLRGTKLFSAVSVSATGPTEANILEVYPFVGFSGTVTRAEKQLAFNSYWDATLNTLSNPSGYPGRPASSSDLKNQTFLAGLGMDFVNVWKISGGAYPELRLGAYTLSSTTSSSGSYVSAPSQAGPVAISIPKRVKVGQRVIIRGANLNRVSAVIFAGTKVNYTIRTNGTLAFRVPKIAPRAHTIKLISELTGTETKKRVKVNSR